MTEHSLIVTLVAALVLSFLFGYAARRLSLSPIVGYLMAGVAVGPFSPGFVGDQNLANQMAEIGVILLMFGVGLKFSAKDLLSVRKVVIPGAIGAMACVAGFGYVASGLFGVTGNHALSIGLSLGVASTVVVLRNLEDRGILKSDIGRILLGWLVIEDLAIVFVLVALPLIASLSDISELAEHGAGFRIALTFAKIGGFVALMLVIGARVVPWVIVQVAHTKSRELLSLAVLAIALGLAYVAYALFGASFALGAFLGGLALNGSNLSHNVAENSLPMRDTFAVLFFVSVGMLFDPTVVIEAPLALAGMVALVLFAKPAVAFFITRWSGLDKADRLFVAASLAQIGEFSFVVGTLSVKLGLMPPETYSVVLAAAIVSIAMNPFMLNLTGAHPPRPVAMS